MARERDKEWYKNTQNIIVWADYVVLIHFLHWYDQHNSDKHEHHIIYILY